LPDPRLFARGPRTIFPRRWANKHALKMPYEITPLSGHGLHALGVPGEMEISVGGFGEITTAQMAAVISKQTGIPTSADDIVNRAIAAQLFAPGYDSGTDLQKRGAALVAMAKSYVDGGDVSSAATRFMPIITRFGLDKTVEAIGLLSDLGLTDMLTSAGESVAGAMLAPLRDLVVAVGEAIATATGSSEFFAELTAELGAALGKLASDMAQMMPIISAGYKLCSMFADWINGLLMLPPESTQPAQVFARDPLDLYLYLCKKLGHCGNDYFGGSWNAWYNPFYQETFVHNSDMRGEAALRAVRALDIGYYTVGAKQLPDWREVMSSPAALEWVRDGNWVDAPHGSTWAFPGHSAENVIGCPCMMLVAGGYGGVGATPGRWHQGYPQFRAAALSACYMTANVACIKGEGSWSSRDSDYVDTSPYYELGYGPKSGWTTWWAKWDVDRIKVLPPAPYYGWTEFIDRVRVLAAGSGPQSDAYRASLDRMGVTVGQYIDDLANRGMQRCLGWGGLYTDNIPRQKMHRFLLDSTWQNFPPTGPDIPKKGSPPGSVDLPSLDRESEGVGAGTVLVAGVGIAGVAGLIWLLTR